MSSTSSGQPTDAADRQTAALRRNLRNPTADDQIRDHVRVVTGVQPYRHNHYSPSEFFRHDPNHGVVENVYGQRIVRTAADFLSAVVAGLEHEVGDAAGDILYRCGYRWGLSDMKAYSARATQEYETEFDKLPMGLTLETWWAPLAAQGWGTWRYDFQHARLGLIVIDLRDSAAAQALGTTGKPVCHLYAGLFAACFTAMFHRELACVELQCRSAGAEHCRFLVSTAQRVKTAQEWRDDGMTGPDIFTKLAEGA